MGLWLELGFLRVAFEKVQQRMPSTAVLNTFTVQL